MANTRKLSQEEQLKMANNVRTTLLVVFAGLSGACYYFREAIDQTGLSVIFFGVLITFLISALLLPKAAQKTDPKEKARAFVIMVLAEGAVLWGCLLYWVFTNILNK